MITDSTSKKAQVFWGLAVFFVLTALDQFSKGLAVKIFPNENFAFSLPLPISLMYLIYGLGIGLIIRHWLKNFSTFPRAESIAWILILSGGVSNLLDRLVLGFARDWIYLGSGVFNLADGYIIIGVLVMSLNYLNSKINHSL